MALIKSTKLYDSIELLSAYYKIGEISIDSIKKYGRIVCSIYKNQESRLKNENIVSMEFININQEMFDNYFSVQAQELKNKNIFAIAYEYLKTLEQFSNTIDA